MDKKQLRAIGHHLKPTVTVAGNGLSESVLAELSRALDDHELVKIKLAVNERDVRASLIAQIEELANAACVQNIGKTALIFRKSETPNPKTSNLIRYLDALS